MVNIILFQAPHLNTFLNFDIRPMIHKQNIYEAMCVCVCVCVCIHEVCPEKVQPLLIQRELFV